ncbi:fungal-specific transcription factor domain-containing protein [Hypoxylon crocopeplum]|nr:fungal-specific transcription factor domain-containing protein [Hypoxylon crocopeplum]
MVCPRIRKLKVMSDNSRAKLQRSAESRPRCRKCHKANRTCQYGIRLQWLEDSVARGIRHGREGVWRPKYTTTRNACTPSSLSRERFQESPDSEGYRAGLKGVVYFLNTFSRDIHLYWRLQAPGEAIGDIALLDEDSPEGNGQLEHLSVASASIEDHEPVSSPYYDEFGGLCWKPTRPIGNAFGFTDQMTQHDGYILKYYNAVVCTSASLVDDQRHNPFRYLILPMAAHSSTIFAAILAVGAVKLAYNDPRYHHRALVHRQRVLTDLKNFLQGVLTDTAKCIEALVSAVMLCWYDISDHCRSSWTSHLIGISGLLDACLGHNSCSADYRTLLQFSQQYLMYHLVMVKSTFRVDGVIPNSKSILSKLLDIEATPTKGCNDLGDMSKEDPHNSEIKRVLSCRDRDSTMWTSFRPANSLVEDELDEIDTHQGFSNRLLLIINDICNLRDPQSSDKVGREGNDGATLERRVIRIQSDLESLTQVPPKTASQFPVDLKTDHHTHRRLELITMTAETNRLAALLFLDETCATHLPQIVPHCRKSRPFFIQRVLSIVQNICDTGPITAALPIWPVFVAGCMASSDDNRLQVLEIFDKFQRQKKFGSLPPALAVIQMVWRQRDLGCDENPRRLVPAAAWDPVGTGSYKSRDRKAVSATSCAHRARYSWERAISMLGGSSLLILT